MDDQNIERTLWNSQISKFMFWPGLGDPTKRRKILKFLAISMGVGITFAVASTLVQQSLNVDNPLRVCIDEREITYRISVTLELYVDGQKAEIPANIGIEEGCTHSLYTLSNDGTIYVEWDEEYPFQIGHFLWTWTTYHKDGFPMRDMNQDKSSIFVNDKDSSLFINEPLIDGYHYRAEFTSKAYDETLDKDFLPPDV